MNHLFNTNFKELDAYKGRWTSHFYPVMRMKKSNSSSRYDIEARSYDEDVRNVNRQELERKALHLVYPVYQPILRHLHGKVLDKFKHSLGQSFNKRVGFNAYVRSWF